MGERGGGIYCGECVGRLKAEHSIKDFQTLSENFIDEIANCGNHIYVWLNTEAENSILTNCCNIDSND